MPTALHRFCDNVRKMPNNACFLVKDMKTGRFKPISWQGVLSRVFDTASYLRSVGVSRGDSVAIYSGTRFEWTVADLAIMSIGAVTVPIYPTLSDDHVDYILKHSGAKIVFAENDDALKRLHDGIEKVVIFDGKSGQERVATFADVPRSGRNAQDEFRTHINDISPDDVATCVYTSGTTGEPKGALITHSNILGEVDGLRKVFSFGHDDIGLLFLPLAHVIARAMQFYQLVHGCVTAYSPSIDKLQDDLKEVRPHYMAAVPRVMEKMHERIMARLEDSSNLKRWLFDIGVDAGFEASEEVRMHRPLSFVQRVKYWLVKKLIFSGLHRKMGGRLKLVISGGAPLEKYISEFFHSVGLLVLEGYGLTETMAAVTINRPDDFRFGTVGKPLDGTQIRLDDDGEILVQGPQVFKGYMSPTPASDGEAFQSGWFKTGDIGEFSRDGFLKIVGRKKDIIITAGGKNIVPYRVESALKTSPFIREVVVFGDRRKFLSALVTLEYEALKDFAKKEGFGNGSLADLAKDARTKELIKSEIECKNRLLARHEMIKKFVILDHDFSHQTGELTPTLKLRRRKIYEKYKDMIEEMYK